MRPACSRRTLLGALIAAGRAVAAEPPPRLPLALPIYSNERTAATTIAALDCVAQAAGLQWQRLHVPQPRLRLLIDSGEALGLSVLLPGDAGLHQASQAIFSSHGWVVVHRDSAWAKGRTIGGPKLSVCVIRSDDRLLLPPFEQAHGRPSRVELVDGDSQAALRMLSHGRCDALLLGSRLDHLGFSRQVAQRSDGLLQVLERPFVHYPVVFLGGQGSEWLRWLPTLNRAIADCGPRIQALLAAEAER